MSSNVSSEDSFQHLVLEKHALNLSDNRRGIRPRMLPVSPVLHVVAPQVHSQKLICARAARARLLSHTRPPSQPHVGHHRICC
jgi:hypothetical protein